MNNQLAKNFFQYGFFFIFPITAIITSEIDVYGFMVNSEMLWMAGATCLLFLVLIKSKHRIQFSRIFITLLIYYLYLILNAAIRGYLGEEYFNKTSLSLLLLSLSVIILIDNLKFYKNDKIKFFNLFPVLILVTFLGILLQVFVDRSLFFGSMETYETLQKIDFKGYWRHASIFDAMMHQQGNVAFIMMTLLMVFRDIKLKNKVDMVSIILLLGVGFFTYTRYVMLSMVLIVLSYYLYYIRHKQQDILLKIIITLFCSIITILIIWSFQSDIEQSDFYQTRILDSISGRTSDPENFLRNYLLQHPIIFGTGFSSYLSEYYYGGIRRLHSGIWDLLFQGGIVGLSLFIFFLYQLHRRAWSIYKANGNFGLLLFAPIIFGINLTARLNLFIFWGYFLVFYYMCLEYQLTLLGKTKVRFPVQGLLPHPIRQQLGPYGHLNPKVTIESSKG